MSNMTSTDIPIPDPSNAIAPPPAAAKRARNRDSILFATAALAVTAVTGGVIMRHKIETLLAPPVGRLTPHSSLHSTTMANGLHPLAAVKPQATSSRATPLSVASSTLSHDNRASSHPAPAATVGSLLALRSNAVDAHKLTATAPPGAPSDLKSVSTGLSKAGILPATHTMTAHTSSGPVVSPVPASGASVGGTKTLAAKTPSTPSAQPLASPPGAKVSSTGVLHTIAKSPETLPVSGASPHAAPVLPAVNALLHPDVLTARPVVKRLPPSIMPATPAVMPDASKTLIPIAHPVQVARNLVAGPLTPQSEIPVLSLVSQLGVLVAQLRNQNLLLTQQVATMQATMDRRLNAFGRTLNIDEAKGALALALHPADAPRAVVQPHIFQPASSVPVGTIPAASYRVIGAGPGYAVLSHDGNAVAASVGGVVPGVGQVLAIHQQGTSWVVETTHGVIH